MKRGGHSADQEAGFSAQKTGVVEVAPPVDGGIGCMHLPRGSKPEVRRAYRSVGYHDASVDGAKLVP